MDDFFNARPLAQAEANASVGQLQAGNLFEQRTPTQGPSMRRIDDADVRRVTVAAEERNIVPLVQLLDQLPDVDSRVNLLRRVDQENANRRRTLTSIPDLVIRDAREYIGRPLPPQSNPPFWFDLPRETGNNIRRLSVSITSGGLLSSETLLYRENFGRTNSNRFLYDHFRTNSVPSLSRPRPSGSVPWYLNR